MSKPEIKVKDNACYGVFDSGFMMFHGTMSDCIEIASDAASDNEGEVYQIGLAGYDAQSGTIVLETPVMSYTREGNVVYVINELL